MQQELDRAGAYNPIGGMGVMMFGPTLLEYGTEAQKQEHIPPIVRGEIQWCQGFSEPGAGSDLACLQTKAEDKGDHFVINGQKIWTSGAQYADWCFCLVRTDTSKKHEGISFVLFDMHQPGVEVRPIQLIAGTSPFCETFFTDARCREEGPGRAAERRLDDRQAAAAARALGPDRRGRRPGRPAASRWSSSPRNMSASTTRAGSPTRDLRTRLVTNDIELARLPADRGARDAGGQGQRRPLGRHLDHEERRHPS